jgi:hypothetical protein
MPNGYEQFNWEATIQQVNQVPDIKGKIIYLSDISAKCEQYILDDGVNPIEKSDHRKFIEKCSIERKRLESNHKTLQLSSPIPVLTVHKNIRLSKANKVKIDFIRVINALYELRFFIDDKDLIPNKEIVMKTFGDSVGIDLTTYNTHLSQAITTGNIEPNIAIFQRMIESTQKLILDKIDNS